MRVDFSDVEHGSADACDDLLRVIRVNFRELEEIIPDDLAHISNRATRTYIQAEWVEHDSDDNYILHFSYSWSIYNGCADMDEAGDEEEFIKFRVDEDGDLIFEKPDYQDYSNREFD